MAQILRLDWDRSREWQQALDRHGFAIVESLIGPADVRRLLDDISTIADSANMRRLLERSAGVRDLLRHPAIRECVHGILGTNAVAVRGLLFDKTPETNWTVPWHQDLSIAVADRHDVAGYGPWSVKKGVVHVEPPAEVLQSMLTIRLHLDDCADDNGPLLVIPGSHTDRHAPETLAQLAQSQPPIPCHVPAGGAVLMRPMIVHASHKAANPGHRRVIHIEFGTNDLPTPLRWYEAYGLG